MAGTDAGTAPQGNDDALGHGPQDDSDEEDEVHVQTIGSTSTSSSQPPAIPRELSPFEDIPIVDPYGRDRGKLLEALFVCGVVFLELGRCAKGAAHMKRLPKYPRWRGLLAEATNSSDYFYSRPCVEQRHLRLSWGEDLKRTRDARKSFTPDARVMFGMSDGAVHVKWLEWDDIWWIVDEYTALKQAVASFVEDELRPYCTEETGKQSLGHKIHTGRERWSGSAVRHCFYWDGGSCTEHSDYGVATLQHSTSDGLEAFLGGAWRPVQPPKGCAAFFAGDMLERLTNGRAKACVHRVCIPDSVDTDAAQGRRRRRAKEHTTQSSVCRQSHVLFLQPDPDTVVRPLAAFVNGAGRDMEAVRYGDWHRTKTNLAFGRAAGAKPQPRPKPRSAKPARDQNSAYWWSSTPAHRRSAPDRGQHVPVAEAWCGWS